MLDKLPEKTQELAAKAFKLFLEDPGHYSLKHHALDDVKKSRHKKGSFAVHVGRHHCAIYVVDGDTNVWYWIGSHEDYNNYTGAK